MDKKYTQLSSEERDRIAVLRAHVNRGLKTSQKQDLKTYHQVEETHEEILEPTPARNLPLINKRTNPVLS